jgi:O-antigen/teichoic acid export membrane protein
MIKYMVAGWQRARSSTMFYAILSTFVRVGANLFLIPIVVRKLSSSELATWWVFAALGGLANLADLGFGQAISRVYSYLWAGAEDFDVEGLRRPAANAQPNQRFLRQFNVSVRLLYLWLSIGALVVLAGAGTTFLMRTEQPGANPAGFWLTWALYVASVIYAFGTSHWTLACQGVNRMRELQMAFLWSGLAYVASAALLLLFGCGLWAMVVASGLRGVICRFICCHAFREAVPEVTAEGLKANLAMIKKIWPNAWKFGLLSLAVYLINSGAVLVCRAFLGEELTASYGLTSQLGLLLVSFSSLWLTVKWPQLTILRAQGHLEEMATLFARRLGWSLLTFCAGGAFLVLLGNRLLEWKGSSALLLPWPYLVVYLLYLGQQLFYGQFGNLTFTENVVPFYRLALCTGVGMMLLSLVLTPRYGMWGLILSPVIVAQFGNSWYPVWRGFRGQPLSPRQLCRAALLGHK